MSENESENNQSDSATTEGIDDDQLPEDLQPTDENPLAQPLDEDDNEVDDLDMKGGQGADQWDDEDLED